MPFYEYKCDACGAVHEAFQKMTDPPLEKCDACGAELRKILHPVAVHFKGKGFYTTDYGREYAKCDGYEAVDRERHRRAEMGDEASIRVVEADEKAAADKKVAAAEKKSGAQAKETQPAK